MDVDLYKTLSKKWEEVCKQRFRVIESQKKLNQLQRSWNEFLAQNDYKLLMIDGIPKWIHPKFFEIIKSCIEEQGEIDYDWIESNYDYCSNDFPSYIICDFEVDYQ